VLLREADCEALLLELATRYDSLVVLGVHKEDKALVTNVCTGPAYMCLGLLAQATADLTTSLAADVRSEL